MSDISRPVVGPLRFERQARITDNFSQVPHGLWTSSLSWGAKSLLGWLHSHDERYLATLTNNRIRNELGASGQVGGWIKELTEAGYLTVGKSGQRNRFVLMAAPWEALAQRKSEPTENRLVDESENEPTDYRSVTDRLPAGNRPKNGHIEYQLEDQGEHQSLAHVSDITQEGEIVEAEIVNGWELSFAAFWKLYPRKVAKAKAQTIWRKLKPDERDAAVQAVPAHVEMWRAEGRAMKHIPHPTTWLNERRYEDPLETDYQPQGSLVQRSARFALEAEARRRYDGSRSDGSDRSSDGDDYGMDGRGRAELCPGFERSGRPGGVDDGGYWFGSDVG